jgi:hypothetical protein
MTLFFSQLFEKTPGINFWENYVAFCEIEKFSKIKKTPYRLVFKRAGLQMTEKTFLY